LVVEDDSSLCDAIAQVVAPLASVVLQAHTLASALEHLKRMPGLIITDIRLPDGNGMTLVDAASALLPVPVTLAISGEATPGEAFELARRGVRGYLQKPLRLPELRDAIREALRAPADLAVCAVAQVGHRAIREAQEQLRRAMVTQACALAGGNRTSAARMLQVSRQAVQQMIRDLGLDEAPSEPRERS
jgi:DNA-binding NtrC family response regulator